MRLRLLLFRLYYTIVLRQSYPANTVGFRLSYYDVRTGKKLTKKGNMPTSIQIGKTTRVIAVPVDSAGNPAGKRPKNVTFTMAVDSLDGIVTDNNGDGSFSAIITPRGPLGDNHVTVTGDPDNGNAPVSTSDLVSNIGGDTVGFQLTFVPIP